jgi:hypothetical protein
MDGWIGATVGSHAIEYVKPFEENELLEFPEHRLNYSQYGMTDVNLYIRDLAGRVPINKVGYYFSKIANLEQDLRNLIFTDYFFKEPPNYNPETLAFLEFLIEKGLGPAREIEAIGVRNLEDDVAQTARSNGTAALIAAKDMYEKLRSVAQSHGLEGDEAVWFEKLSTWYHELCHVYIRQLMSKSNEEVKVGELLAEFFGQRSSLLEERIAKYYKTLSSQHENYALNCKSQKLLSSKLESLNSKIESLIRKYASEARAIGMNDEEMMAYVTDRIEGEINELEKDAEDYEKMSYSQEGESPKEESSEDASESEQRDNKDADKENLEGQQPSNSEVEGDSTKGCDACSSDGE